MTGDDRVVVGQAEQRLLVHIDEQRCEGHAICFMVAPEMFGVDDDGRGRVTTPLVAPEHMQAARAAVDRCPENAITIEQRPSSA